MLELLTLFSSLLSFARSMASGAAAAAERTMAVVRPAKSIKGWHEAFPGKIEHWLDGIRRHLPRSNLLQLSRGGLGVKLQGQWRVAFSLEDVGHVLLERFHCFCGSILQLLLNILLSLAECVAGHPVLEWRGKFIATDFFKSRAAVMALLDTAAGGVKVGRLLHIRVIRQDPLNGSNSSEDLNCSLI